MDNFFKAALSVGGLGTVGAAIFFGLYKDWLALDIFTKLSADQTFIIMLVFLGLVFLSLIVLVIAYILKGININSAKATNNSVAIINDKK
ncbi:hypothetical protein [Pseudoalteromonas sp. SWYJZ19]|uniref:hypothetical protein n=1 Tax=Pseudoalteromonas sp. SWYJZ19 TaxID=2792068 RepID=UPI0018CFBD31|nr:hypothetical protein [Pseudoalteromonas sp. SWYJZ19]MBH0052227.1 hypothetical protein [Pseudoalteromonas sp. SWYJZ19]